MTTEDDENIFHAMLDANPDDAHTRLVFADWLEERGDARAAGYRALGALRLRAIRIVMENHFEGLADDEVRFIFGGDFNKESAAIYGECQLPRSWIAAMPHAHDDDCGDIWRYFLSRREAEDAAALAFAKLPQSRRLELLAVPA